MTSIRRVDLSMIANLGLNLFVLQMPKCNISEIESDAFNTLTNLKEINMSGNRLTRIPNRLFANTRAIAKIDFSNNNLELLDNSLFQELQNLNILNLSGNRLVNIPENLPRVLTYLNMENNMISRIETQTKLTNLQHLNLCKNRISSFNFLAMECSKLHSLCLDDGAVRLVYKGNYCHHDFHYDRTLLQLKTTNRKKKTAERKRYYDMYVCARARISLPCRTLPVALSADY